LTQFAFFAIIFLENPPIFGEIPLARIRPGRLRRGEWPFTPLPWKSTKLVFCGVPVRRRTLYGITLALGIATVPAWSWAVLMMLNRNPPHWSRLIYLAAAVLVSILALYGTRSILKRKAVLYYEEARRIWPVALVGLFVAAGLAIGVAETFLMPSPICLIVPGVFAAPWLVFILWRWMKLNDAPKHHDRPRQSSSRHGSTPPFPPVHDEPSPTDADAEED
jgi:hypothetical protein